MSSLVRQTRQLERVIRRKERIFLMEQYASSMLQQLEPSAAEGQADEPIVDALRIAYRYVNPELGARVSALLAAYGYTGDLEAERQAAEEEEEAAFEEEEEQPAAPKKAKAAEATSEGEGEEDEEAGVLFERDIYTGRKPQKKTGKPGSPAEDGAEDVAGLFSDDEDRPQGNADDLFAEEEEEEEKTAQGKKAKTRKAGAQGQEEEEDAADLFADDEEAEKTAQGKKAKTRKAGAQGQEEDAAGLFAEEDEDRPQGDADDLFADEEEEAAEKTAQGKKAKARKAGAQDQEEEDADDLFADDEDEDAAEKTSQEKKAKTRKAGAQDQEEEDADDLFADDEDEDAGALFEQDIYTADKKKTKKRKRRGDEEEEEETGEADVEASEEEEETRGFRPGKRRARRETPGFAAPESAVERDEKSRRGFAHYAPDPEAEEALAAKSKVRKRPGRLPDEEEEEEEEQPEPRKGRRERSATEEEEEEAEERSEAPARPRREPRPAAAEEEREEKGKKQGRDAQAADPKAEEKKLNLDALTYQVSIEDLRTHMGISLVREDHVKLMRRWEQKSRDNSIRLLLDDPKATQHPYALIPRITRFIKDGQMVQVNVLNLVRHFYQLFENVPQVIQLKNEPFFVTEVPTLEWAVVACEALPDTLNKTVLEQRTIFSHYIQKFMSNERRVRRRVLVEALYDIIVLNLVAKEPILRKTVDLTETRRGRQQQMCVNFGAKGIRISSIGRDQRHPQMGMCPSW